MTRDFGSGGLSEGGRADRDTSYLTAAATDLAAPSGDQVVEVMAAGSGGGPPPTRSQDSGRKQDLGELVSANRGLACELGP